MAIGVGSGLSFKPYVHSNIYNFHAVGLSDTSLDRHTTEGKERLQKAIDDIWKVRNELKKEADDFLEDMSPQAFSNMVFNKDDTYRKIAFEVLKSPNMIPSLTNNQFYNTKAISNKFGPAFEKVVLDVMKTKGIEQIGINALIDMIIQELRKFNFFNATASSQRDILSQIFKDGASKEVINKITKAFKKEQDTIRKRLKQMIGEQQRASTDKSSIENGIAYFTDEFKKRCEAQNLTYTSNNSPQIFANRVASILRKQVKQFFLDESNASGVVGEDFKFAILNSDTRFQATVVSTANITEAKLGDGGAASLVKNKDQQKLINSIWSEMKTHHDVTKKSQTDYFIIKGKKMARVQDKNAQQVLLKLFNNNQSGIPQIAKIQDATSYTKLLEQLKNTNTLHMTDQDIEDLSYLLANEVWFRVKGSYGDIKGRGVGKYGGLKYTISTIENILSQEIINFLGVTIGEDFTVVGGASNIFYSFSNSVIIPTYYILDGIIKQLQGLEKTIFYTKVTLDNIGKVAFKNSDNTSFYQAKESAVDGRLDVSGNYTDPKLIAVGTEEGASIINSLNISRINLNVDLEKLVKTSSWNFELTDVPSL